MLVWQAAELNEWAVVIRRCLKNGYLENAAAVTDVAVPHAFSLADPETVSGILRPAGFDDVTVTDVHHPVFYGADVAAALDWVRGFATVTEAVKGLNEEAAS